MEIVNHLLTIPFTENWYFRKNKKLSILFIIAHKRIAWYMKSPIELQHICFNQRIDRMAEDLQPDEWSDYLSEVSQPSGCLIVRRSLACHQDQKPEAHWQSSKSPAVNKIRSHPCDAAQLIDIKGYGIIFNSEKGKGAVKYKDVDMSEISSKINCNEHFLARIIVID